MGEYVTDAILHPRPLLAVDAGGLLASVVPQGPWQPTFLLETQRGLGYTPGAAGLTATNDTWRFNIYTPGNMPDLCFLPVALRANFHGPSSSTTQLAAFFQSPGLYNINFNTEETWEQYCHDAVAWEGPLRWYDGTNPRAVMTLSAPMAGYPPAPGIAERTTPDANALAALCFRCDAWDGTVGTVCQVSIDARFLAFPRAAVNSAGFYMPRLSYKTV